MSRPPFSLVFYITLETDVMKFFALTMRTPTEDVSLLGEKNLVSDV